LVCNWHATGSHRISHSLPEVVHFALVLLCVCQDLCRYFFDAHLLLLKVIVSRRIFHKLLYFVHSIGVLPFALNNLITFVFLVRELVFLFHFFNHYLVSNVICFSYFTSIRLEPVFKLLSEPLFINFKKSFQLLGFSLFLFFFGHPIFLA